MPTVGTKYIGPSHTSGDTNVAAFLRWNSRQTNKHVSADELTNIWRTDMRYNVYSFSLTETTKEFSHHRHTDTICISCLWFMQGK